MLKGKRLLLWKEMLQSIGYSDMGVCDEFFSRTHLNGQTDWTGLWPSKVTPATLTEPDLHAQARLQRTALSYQQVVLRRGESEVGLGPDFE